MLIQILQDSSEQANDSLYRSLHLASDNREILVGVVSGKHNHVNVIVNNASHKVWRKFGKQFNTIDEAINHYKTAAIKSMLQFVKEHVNEKDSHAI